jgi:hypothetical protein
MLVARHLALQHAVFRLKVEYTIFINAVDEIACPCSHASRPSRREDYVMKTLLQVAAQALQAAQMPSARTGRRFRPRGASGTSVTNVFVNQLCDESGV